MPDNESRAMKAALAVKAGTATQSEAARHHGISRQAVHRALERLAKRAGATPPATQQEG